jgi:hypothetical protein
VLVQVGPVSVIQVLSSNRLVLSDGTAQLVTDDLAFPYDLASYPLGTCFTRVTGILDTAPVDGTFRLLPRSAFDLAVGSGCK